MLLLLQPKYNTKFLGLLVFCLFLAFSYNHIYSQDKQYVVVLDAGHGGGDPGKVGYGGLKEKDIALKITNLVGDKLTRNKSIKVVFTRNKDVFVDLWKRGSIANKANADLFVSIHCNSHSSEAIGAETWVLGIEANETNLEVAKRENAVIKLEENYKDIYKGFDPDSAESLIGLSVMQEENLDKSLLLASIIQENLHSQLKRRDRGVKQARFVVLHQTYMPSVLVETGFITNKKESKYLNSSKGQKEIANTIAKAIEKYVNRLQVNTVITTDNSEKESVIFKVQIAAGRNKLKEKSYNFRGLEGIERVKVGNYYKYYYGSSNSYDTIKKALDAAKEKGYKTAFLVAFKNGKKITIKEALK